ncbi:hypothetical protein [Actinomadura algeriensis]|uniref:Uncharacterized protein n=1 Tax=Actinomadura algeriensis TaxID=1679523 RepID=A0ABR9JPJ4_9ACTN|nr:hypothetical protein [Actinomadura algeriensis]MBE1532480.1 hypothetical protein [Actinomadura algeriensis]
MNDDRRPGRPNRRAAKLLLAGSSPAGRHTALRALLDAAAPPEPAARPAGEDAAAAAFTAAAAAARARPAAPERPRRSVLRRFVTVKAMVVTVTVAVFGGGVAYATITGNLPGQDERRERSPSPSPSRTDPAAPGRHVHPVAPPALSSPNARTSAPDAPGRTAGRGRSASAQPSTRPSAPTGLPTHAVRPSPGPPSGLPTEPAPNANPRAKKRANDAEERANGQKTRQAPPAWSNGDPRG